MLSRSLRPLLTLLVVLHTVLAERMYYNLQGRAQDFSLWGKTDGPRAGWSSWEGAATLSPQLETLGTLRVPPAGFGQMFSAIFSTKNDLF